MTFPRHHWIRLIVIFVASLLASSRPLFAQSTIRLYSGVAPGSESWSLPESIVAGPFGPMVTNVSQPTLTVYRPDPGTSTGTAAIVIPGGGFHFLAALEDEGKFAEWLRARGITAFLLKYRVQQLTPEHIGRLFGESVEETQNESIPVFPLALADARNALTYVRAHADEFGISPTRVGVIGGSAGAMLTISLTLTSPEGQGPDFVAPLYTDVNDLMRPLVVPKWAPPAFIAVASDDQLGFAHYSAELYLAWLAAGRPAELHAYAQGGHGFHMRLQGLPVDTWRERFEEWLRFGGWLKRPQ
jgi:acetyl esterase/lipase